MSGLQLGLLLLGALVLAGVLAHALWQSRRDTPRHAATPPTLQADQEPGFERTEPELAHAAADAPPRLEPGAPRRVGGARLDALIDAVATLTIDSPIAGEAVIVHLPPTRRAGSKPLLIEGLNADSGDWEPPQPGQRYGELQAGVQLANRSGALNEIEYSEFVQKVQAFAEPLGALPDFPDMLDVVARARELDAFAAQHDAQLVLRLVSSGPAWSPGYVQQQAARQGFTPGALPGRLVHAATEDGAPPVLTLSFDAQATFVDDPSQSAVRELILSFDVPQTAADGVPFAAWSTAGEGLALALDAALHDNHGQPLPHGAFVAIREELERLYAVLAERDLAAGSPAARRLFS